MCVWCENSSSRSQRQTGRQLARNWQKAVSDDNGSRFARAKMVFVESVSISARISTWKTARTHFDKLLCILLSINSRTFVPYALGPALMARGRFGAVCLAAARPMLPQRPPPKLHNIIFCPFPTPSTTLFSLSCQVVWGDVLTNLQKEKARKRAFKVSIIRFPVNIFRFRVLFFFGKFFSREYPCFA